MLSRVNSAFAKFAADTSGLLQPGLELTWGHLRRQLRALRPGAARMAQNITLTSKMMVDQARAQIEEIPVDAALKLHGDPSVVFVDIRDPRELARDGKIPGAVHAPRGMLEFWIDPTSPYYKDVFGQDKKYVFFCAGGMRSVLATKVAQDMGLKPVAHIIGGFGAWKKAGGPVEMETRKDG